VYLIIDIDSKLDFMNEPDENFDFIAVSRAVPESQRQLLITEANISQLSSESQIKVLESAFKRLEY